MTLINPGENFNNFRKLKTAQSDDDAIMSPTITVPADRYGVVYGLTLSLNVASTTDLDNLVAGLLLQVTMGSTQWTAHLHPYVVSAITTVSDQLDLGPWTFGENIWGRNGFYSGVLGDNIVVNVGAAGTGIKTTVVFNYAGD